MKEEMGKFTLMLPLVILMFVLIGCSTSLTKPFSVEFKIKDGVCDSLREDYTPMMNIGYDYEQETAWLYYEKNPHVKEVCLEVKGVFKDDILCEVCSNESKQNLTCEVSNKNQLRSTGIADINPPCKIVDISLVSKSSQIFYYTLKKATLVSNGGVSESLNDCKLPYIEEKLFPETSNTYSVCFRDITKGDNVYLEWFNPEDRKFHQETIKIS